ncbi:MAG: MerR family transcriptional regulator [Bacteroidia bacterium]|nr:MAG: MerR family transcriptional regulator [Bacteroidia bacterium]
MATPKRADATFELENNRPVYTLGVASQLADIPSHSIRQYIDMGLIIPFKLESKRHLFSQNDINRLKLIQGLIHDKGLNFAGVRTMMAMVPCWALRKCSERDKLSCNAYAENFQPCWMASQKGSLCKNMDCRECEVYHALDLDAGIKSVLYTLV